MELIERQAAIDGKILIQRTNGVEIYYDEAVPVSYLKRLPPAQPEIIYCKECKHKGTRNCVANALTIAFHSEVKDDFYCGLAERRTDDLQHKTEQD